MRITAIKILGYDEDGKEHNISDCVSDVTDQSLSYDIEDWLDEREEDE
jgi:hypothetical protein